MENLSEEIAPLAAFKVEIAGHVIYITNSVVNEWLILLITLVVCVLLTRNLQIVPKKPQAVLEMLIDFLKSFFNKNMEGEGKEYYPYLASIIIFLALSNTIGFFGLTPPTKDINVTSGLALMSIIVIQIAGIRKKGVGGWLHSFLEPIIIVSPINVLELGIKPMSLCMRLFGNVLGAYIIMELLKSVCALIVPQVFSLYFDIFDGLIQAYVFVFLTSLFIKESIE